MALSKTAHHACALFVIALGAFVVGVSYGQTPSHQQPPRQHLRMGYVPKHIKIQRKLEQPPSVVTSSVSPVARRVSFNATDGYFYDEGSCDDATAPIGDGSYCADSKMVPKSTLPSCTRGDFLANGKLWFWGRAEYLGWWTKGMAAPALATTSPTNTDQDAAGVIGQPGTTVLFGNTRLGEEAQSGGRFALGAWFTPCRTRGIEFNYVGIWDQSTLFSASNEDFSILARPFVNAQSGSEDALLIAFPNLVDGSLLTDATTDFQAMDVSLRKVEAYVGGSEVTWFFGYRYAGLDDALNIATSTLSTSGPTSGTTIDLFDRFDTESTFHGPQIGFQVSGSRGWWSLDLSSKVAVGVTSFAARVAGQSVTTTETGDSSTVDAGLLAQATNIGVYDESQTSAVTEVRLSLRRRLNSAWSATFGYTAMAWSDVLRASEQIDLNVNTSQIPPGTLEGRSRPTFPFSTTSFWAQGLHVGLEHWY